MARLTSGGRRGPCTHPRRPRPCPAFSKGSTRSNWGQTGGTSAGRDRVAATQPTRTGTIVRTQHSARPPGPGLGNKPFRNNGLVSRSLARGQSRPAGCSPLQASIPLQSAVSFLVATACRGHRCAGWVGFWPQSSPLPGLPARCRRKASLGRASSSSSGGGPAWAGHVSSNSSRRLRFPHPSSTPLWWQVPRPCFPQRPWLCWGADAALRGCPETSSPAHTA